MQGNVALQDFVVTMHFIACKETLLYKTLLGTMITRDKHQLGRFINETKIKYIIEYRPNDRN